MSSRGFETTTPAKVETTTAQQREALDNETTHHTPLTFVTSGAAAPNPQAQAAALYQASGGRLARAGDSLLQLQHSYGNRHVQRMVEHTRTAPVIQRKMVLGPADDKYECEADRVARQVVGHAAQWPASGGAETGRVMRMPDIQPMHGAEGGAVDVGVQQAIQQARGGGQPLPDQVRGSMEQALGADFGAVRVHTDAQADQLNRSLQARAFTTGQDIFFRQGEYSPASTSGRQVLAHELTHVVQQAGFAEAPAATDRSADDAVGNNASSRQTSNVLSLSPGGSVQYIQRMIAEFKTAIDQDDVHEAMSLINANKKLDEADENGDTALHIVVKLLQTSTSQDDPNFIDVAKLLIFKQYDLVTKKNNDGKTPVDLIIKEKLEYSLSGVDSEVLAGSMKTAVPRNIDSIRAQLVRKQPENDESFASMVMKVVTDITPDDLKIITNAAKKTKKVTKGEIKVVNYLLNRASPEERNNIEASISKELKGAVDIRKGHMNLKQELRSTEKQDEINQSEEWIDTWKKHTFYAKDQDNKGAQKEKRLRQIYSIERLRQIYNNSEILKPVMDVATLAMRGYHDRFFSNQRYLNIYIVSPEKLGEKASNLAEGGGVYPFENGIFIAADLLEKNDVDAIVGVILHEVTHFVANEVFKNKALPYFRGKKGNSQQHDDMMTKVEKIVSNYKPSDEDDQKAHKIMENVFSSYQGPARDPELIVRVSEIIGALGPRKGTEWVRKNYPDLYEYFTQTFLPEVNKYLTTHVGISHLETTASATSSTSGPIIRSSVRVTAGTPMSTQPSIIGPDTTPNLVGESERQPRRYLPTLRQPIPQARGPFGRRLKMRL